MNLGKKLVALGIIGTLVVGQSVSALAASFTVDAPFVRSNASSYQVTGTISATTADYYLSLRQWMVYIPNGSVSEYASNVNNHYSASKVKSFSYTDTFNINGGVAKRAISRGYYSNTQGVQQTLAGQTVKQLG